MFTKLDLQSAFNLIQICDGGEWKTAFVIPTGHYEYYIMPYGLVNAPSVFQDFMHEVLREYTVYISHCYKVNNSKYYFGGRELVRR